MKRLISLLCVLVLLLGCLPHGLPAAAASIDNLQFDDHVDVTGKTV